MEIHSYFNNNGKDLIRDYIDQLPIKEQIDADDVLNQMEKGEFETLYTKRWQGKIWEVYFYKHNRIFYVFADKDNVYLLYICKKQKNKTEKKDTKTIKKRALELSKLLQIKIL